MAKINLIPQNFGTIQDVIPDIEGVVYSVSGATLTTTCVNPLEGQRAISGFLVLFKSGFCDVYINIVDSATFEIIRSANIAVKLVIF
jgi:hypothetical protein